MLASTRHQTTIKGITNPSPVATSMPSDLHQPSSRPSVSSYDFRNIPLKGSLHPAKSISPSLNPKAKRQPTRLVKNKFLVSLSISTISTSTINNLCVDHPQSLRRPSTIFASTIHNLRVDHPQSSPQPSTISVSTIHNLRLNHPLPLILLIPTHHTRPQLPYPPIPLQHLFLLGRLQLSQLQVR